MAANLSKVDLLKPIVNDRTRSVNFFNGRLLSGEDLTAEQHANRAAHSLLGQALGSGVAYGLEVSEAAAASTTAGPVLSIRRGLAVNRNGATLLLNADAQVSLARPASAVAARASVFADCAPAQTGAYVAGAGVYLLTIGPASAPVGLAEVSGVAASQAPCNTRYNAEGVQFRLIQLDLTPAELGDAARLQNVLAYKCFGAGEWNAFRADPFGSAAAGRGFGLLDRLRAAGLLTDCEVPLAAVYWTATGGLVFVDMWSVRRRVTGNGESKAWPLYVNDAPRAESEARFLQFQAQLQALLARAASPGSIAAASSFRFLPPAGILPVATGAAFPGGFDYLQFFSGLTYSNPVFTEGARLETILRQALLYRPIDLASGELIRLYLARENRQPPPGAAANTAQPYLLFVTGQAPYYGDAHFNVAHWGYSNY